MLKRGNLSTPVIGVAKAGWTLAGSHDTTDGLAGHRIATGGHCFGCAAGAGSICGRCPPVSRP